MNASIPTDDLPTPDETVAYIARQREDASGANWAAVTAGFVCPGAGQLLCGHKSAGITFIAMFVIAVLIAFVPLGRQLYQAMANIISMNAPMPGPMPWIPIGGGIGLALLVWIAAMIHAAGLKQPATQ